MEGGGLQLSYCASQVLLTNQSRVLFELTNQSRVLFELTNQSRVLSELTNQSRVLSELTNYDLCRDDICHGIRRLVSEHTYIAGVWSPHNQDSGVTVLAGSRCPR